MNNLFIFGDSFSFPYKLELENTWMHILSKKLNLELNLFSNPGASNFQIYLKVIEHLKNISDKDIVIISTSWCDRYFIPMFQYGISKADIEFKKQKNIDLENIEKFYEEKYTDQIAEKFYSEKFENLFLLMEKLNINFFYWNVSELKINYDKNLIYPKYSKNRSFFYEWIEKDNSMWFDSQDKHLGIEGSKQVAEHFYKKIIHGK